MTIKRARARAPTKVTLFGEHAVVYGHPALVASVPLYVEVEAEKSEGIVLESGPISLDTLEVKIGKDSVSLLGKSRERVLKFFSYILSVLEDLGIDGVKLRVISPLPVGAGMGTSAAVTVATLEAVNELFDLGLSKEDIAKLAWKVETKVQGRASPMDTAAATYGGLLLVRKEGDEWRIERLEPTSVPLVVGILRKRKTTGELVADVARRVERVKLLEEVMKLIGKITLEALDALRDGDLETLGELMNVNHGLLEALGVVNAEVAELVYTMRENGAYGAKVSGAGYGGAVVGVAEDPERVKNLVRIRTPYAFSFKEFAEGVHIY